MGSSGSIEGDPTRADCWTSEYTDGRTINVASDSDYSLIDIVRTFEAILGKKATTEFVDKGGAYAIDTTEMAPYASAAGVRFDEGYLERVLRKYYGQHHVR